MFGVWQNLRNKAAHSRAEKQPIEEDIPVTGSKGGFKRQPNHPYLVTDVFISGAEKEILFSAQRGIIFNIKGQEVMVQAILFLLLLHLIF